MGKAEKTEYEAVFEKFCSQVDSAKEYVVFVVLRCPRPPPN
jgi:hypothetical protein